MTNSQRLPPLRLAFAAILLALEALGRNDAAGARRIIARQPDFAEGKEADAFAGNLEKIQAAKKQP